MYIWENRPSSRWSWPQWNRLGYGNLQHFTRDGLSKQFQPICLTRGMFLIPRSRRGSYRQKIDLRKLYYSSDNEFRIPGGRWGGNNWHCLFFGPKPLVKDACPPKLRVQSKALGSPMPLSFFTKWVNFCVMRQWITGETAAAVPLIFLKWASCYVL